MAGSLNLIFGIALVAVLTSVQTMKLQHLPSNHFSLHTKSLELEEPSEVEDKSMLTSEVLMRNELIGQDKNHYLQNIKSKQPISSFVEPEHFANKVQLPKTCENSTYCEEVINYPEEPIRILIQKLEQSRNLQNIEMDQPDFTHRISDENFALCDAKQKFVYPQAALGYDNKYHFILNGKTKETKFQTFWTESCSEMGGKCNNVASYEMRYRGRCKQFYIYHEAIAFRMISDTEVEHYQTQIKLPGYCTCVAERTAMIN